MVITIKKEKLDNKKYSQVSKLKYKEMTVVIDIALKRA